MRSFLASIALAAAMLAFWQGPSAVAAEEQVILRLEGKVAAGAQLSFTRSDLEKLGMKTIRTSTPWHDGEQVFEGVPMDKLMEAAGARGDMLEIVALNRYRSQVPVSDFRAHGPILALKRNGAYMSVRDKGPLFIIYPYDSDPRLRTEQFYSRSVWQIASIHVN